MRPVYGGKGFTRPDIHVWCTKFVGGSKSIVDKIRPGWHVVATTDATIATVDAFVQSDRHASISDIVRYTDISRDLVHSIVNNHFKFFSFLCCLSLVSYDRKLVEKIIHR